MGTLADLVNGFQSGYTGVQDSRRRRKLNKAIDQELSVGAEKAKGRQAGRERLGYGQMGEGTEFSMPKTYGERLVGFIKGKFGGSTGQQGTQAISPEVGASGQAGFQPAGAQASGAQTYGVEENRYADRDAFSPTPMKDGGAVRHYANGGRSVQPNRSAGVPSQQANGGTHVENPLPGYTDGGMARPTAPGQMTPQPMGATAIPTPNRQMMAGQRGQALPGFADGGRAETEEEARARREALIERDSEGNPVTSGGGFLEGAKDVGRNVLGNTRRRMSEWAPEGIAADRAVLEAEGAADTGRAIRRDMVEGAKGVGQLAAGLWEDTAGAVVNPVARGVGGFLGYGTSDEGGGEEAPGPGKGVKKGDKEAAVTQAVNPNAAQAARDDPPGSQTPQAQAAAQPAGPPDEIVDFTQVRDVDPQDMPNMTVTDWEDERRFWAAQAISLGNDPFEAMKAVDARQMRGFGSYGQQALQMLQNGDATGAARAMYAAYQYFPNGADVRFGVQKGVNGQPVLIGMGTDEETGEPLKEGKPQVITPESLATQLENMSNPSALRTWTKDWRDTEQEIREYNEVTKPAAESTARYQDRAGQASVLRAQADYNTSLGAGTGGLKQTDLDRANSAFMEAVELEGFTNPEQADAMMDMMTQIYQRHAPNVQYPTVVRDVRDAIRSGDMTALDQKYGQ